MALASVILLVVGLVFSALNDHHARIVGLVLFIAYPAIGYTIVRVLPRNAVGWCFLASSLLLNAESDGTEVAGYGLAHGWPDAVVHLAAWFQSWAWFPGIFLLVTVGLLRFPDSALIGSRWRWVERVSYAALIFWTGAIGTATAFVPARRLLSDAAPEPSGGLGMVFKAGEWMFVIIFACVLASLVSLVVRYRRGNLVEREQTKWVLSAAALAILIELVLDLGGSTAGHWPDWVQTLGEGVGFALIAIATGVAITRYKLYEIERIVSRTVSYAVVLIVLAGLYVGALLAAVQITHFNNVGVAGATLLVSIVAVPLTRRVRRVVDRRFNRSRFDAERVVTAFAGRLRARPELGDVPIDLIDVLDRTVQPAHAAVWLVPSSR